MPKKNWLLLGVLVVLATVYVYFFTDWFKPQVIEIFHTSRLNRMTMRGRRGDAPTTIPVVFGLNYRYKLTELKVVPLLEWQTNKHALPVWHLVSSSNSIPIKTFFYGQPIRGMTPAMAGTHPDPLEPNVTYHLILESGKAKGEHDFEARPIDSQ